MGTVAVFEKAGLPAVGTLPTALRALEQEVGVSGLVILKMDKTGAWVFGADQTEVQDGSKWAVNPFSFIHGYIAWGEGEVLAEKMVGIAQPLPDPGEAPAAAKKGWESQVGMSLKCMSGEDVGMEVRFTTTSVGGKRAVQTLAAQIADQVEKDAAKPVPLVMLGNEHYQHKQYGKIYTPVLTVTEWIGLDGGEAEPAPAAAEPPKRRRRPAVA